MKRLLLIALVLMAPVATFAQGGGGGNAGNGGRGGGYALVCYKKPEIRDAVLTQVTLRPALRGVIPMLSTAEDYHLQPEKLLWPPVMADYWQMLKKEGLSIAQKAKWGTRVTASGFKSDLSQVAQEVRVRYYDLIEQEHPDYWDLFKRVRTGVDNWRVSNQIPRVMDARHIGGPADTCLYIQVAFFDDVKRTVEVDLDLYNLFDFENRQALWLHEDTTHYYREGLRQCVKTFDNLIAWAGTTSRIGTVGDRDSNLGSERWCDVPSPGTTDPARDQIAHLLARRHGKFQSPLEWSHEFRRLSAVISAAVTFGEDTIAKTFGELDAGDIMNTHVIRRYNEDQSKPERIARVEAPFLMLSSWWLWIKGLEAPFPVPR